jgi:hypothetical protein
MEINTKTPELRKLYTDVDSADLSFGAKEGSSSRSPTPLGGPMLQRAVLCVTMASFIF